MASAAGGPAVGESICDNKHSGSSPHHGAATATGTWRPGQGTSGEPLGRHMGPALTGTTYCPLSNAAAAAAADGGGWRRSRTATKVFPRGDGIFRGPRRVRPEFLWSQNQHSGGGSSKSRIYGRPIGGGGKWLAQATDAGDIGGTDVISQRSSGDQIGITDEHDYTTGEVTRPKRRRGHPSAVAGIPAAAKAASS